MKGIRSMSTRLFAAITIFGMTAATLMAQAPPAAPGGPGGGRGRGPGRGDGASTAPAPKNAEGKPDISGAWSPNAIQYNVDMVKAGVKIPFQPWAEKAYHEAQAKNDPEAHCLPPGLPRMSTTPYPFRIAQTPGLTLIVYEGAAHVWRQIFTDGRPHEKDPNPSWLGDSIGKWDGDTFVVDTTGLNGKTWIDESGLPETDKMHVIERIRRVDMGHLEIEHTVDDPGAYTEPWKFTTRPTQLKGELLEYICQENNKDLDHLSGPAK